MSSFEARSLAEMFRLRVQATPDRVAFLYPTDPGWATLTWKDVDARVRAIACGLRALGLEDEQRCAILATTRLDWVLCDFGIMCAGGATTTIYPSNTPDECAYILNDSACRVAFVENAEQLEKLRSKRAEIGQVVRVVVIDGPTADDGWAISLEAFMASGRAHHAAHPAEYDAVIDRVTGQSLATLVYTSGTTGRPKGVELVHDCWVYEAKAIDDLRLLRLDDVHYLWLPLSHIFGKVLEAAQIRIGFPTAIDGRIDKLVENLGEVKPTFVAGVPRIFEKIHNRVVMGAQEAGGAKLKIFRWAMQVGREVSALVQQGQQPTGLLKIKNSIAEALVFKKLQARFGGRLRFFISGSAPLSKDVALFFHAAGILIAEGYGLTETSAASCVNVPERYRIGTVGPPLPGTEVKIAPEDGEILIRGRGVMRGYHNLPDATRETLDADGWLHTGDIGEIVDNTFVRITDRKKDLIKTSGGKYVAPQALEGKLKILCPYLSQVLVHGNNRNFCSALVTLDEESIRKWLKEHGETADGPMAEIARNPKVHAMVERAVGELNRTLASYETVKKFAILERDFTIDGGELTASMKMKRKAVEQQYRALLDGFYGDSVARVCRAPGSAAQEAVLQVGARRRVAEPDHEQGLGEREPRDRDRVGVADRDLGAGARDVGDHEFVAVLEGRQSGGELVDLGLERLLRGRVEAVDDGLADLVGRHRPDEVEDDALRRVGAGQGLAVVRLAFDVEAGDVDLEHQA